MIDPISAQFGGGSEPLRDTFWCRVSSILGDTPVLPSLKVVTFSSFDYRHAIDMGALDLLSPPVRELTIRFNRAGFGDASRFRIAFSSSLSATPHPERLSVMVVPWSSVDLESLSRSYSRLRYLQVDSKIEPYYLTFVASLIDLEHLSIRLSFHSSEA